MKMTEDLLKDITFKQYLVLSGIIPKGQVEWPNSDYKKYLYPDYPFSKYARFRDKIQEKLDENKKKPGCEFLKFLEKNPNYYCFNPALDEIEVYIDTTTPEKKANRGISRFINGSDQYAGSLANIECLSHLGFNKDKMTDDCMSGLYNYFYAGMLYSDQRANAQSRELKSSDNMMNLSLEMTKTYDYSNLQKWQSDTLKNFYEKYFLFSNIKGDRKNAISRGMIGRGISIGGYLDMVRVSNYLQEAAKKEFMDTLNPIIIDSSLKERFAEFNKLNKYVGIIACANTFFITSYSSTNANNYNKFKNFYQSDELLDTLYNHPKALAEYPNSCFWNLVEEASKTYKDNYLGRELCTEKQMKQHQALLEDVMNYTKKLSRKPFSKY